jgi:hypothetical protein
MVRRQATALAAAGAAAGVLVLVWAAVVGPVDVVSSWGPRLQPPDTTPRPATPSSGGTGGSAREILGDRRQTLDLSWVGDLLAWLLLLALVLVAVLVLRRVYARRRRLPPRPADVDFEVVPEADRVGEALADGAGAQLAAVEEGTPRNGIVACWLRLEEDIADAGLPRRPWETSGELVVRVLRQLDLDPRAVGTLARLYREARFSTHELGEDARSEARSCLDRFHADLGALGRSRGAAG